MATSARTRANINLNAARTDGVADAAVGLGSGKSESVAWFFDRLPEELMLLIEQHRPAAIVGCVAWFTHSDLLQRLIDMRIPCLFLVQKERSFQPDKFRNQTSRAFYAAQRLRRLYDQLTPLQGMAHAVRCMGVAKSTTNVTPLMHHKFLVFCSVAPTAEHPFVTDTCWTTQLCPDSLWTGSFNLSQNGARGCDNALFFANQTPVSEAYLGETRFVYQRSESLDWVTRSVKQMGK